MTSCAFTKACEGFFHAQQQLLIPQPDILTMKYTPANFIGHLLAKSSMKITFFTSQKHICPIWVGFFLQSMGILWLLYQVLNVIKWFLGLNIWNGRSVPSRFGFDQKTSICMQPRVKSREIHFFSIFQLWHLQTTVFSHPYQFLWVSVVKKYFFFKNEKKIRFFEFFFDFSKNGPHCYSIRSNLKKMGPLQFCLPVFLGTSIGTLNKTNFLIPWGIFEIIPFIYFYLPG